MHKLILAGASLLLLATPVLAQVGPPRATTPGQPRDEVFVGGGPDVANSGPASTGSLSRSGSGGDDITNNPGAAGNVTNPSRAQPNTGGGGGGEGGQ